MSRNSDTPPLSRPLRVDEIEYGAESEIVVTENEMAAIALPFSILRRWRILPSPTGFALATAAVCI